MTKAEYILIKKNNPIDIVYEYYKEFANGKLLGYQEFYNYIQMWADMNRLFAKVSKHYDTQFNVSSLLNKYGEVIGYV
jgi:hypothetical protein